MAHGFLTPEDLRGKGSLKLPKVDIPWKKMFDLLNNVRKDQNIQLVRVSEIQNRLEGRDQKALPPGLKMLRGSAPNLLSGNNPNALPPGQRALPPGGPRLPGTAEPPSGGRKGGTYSKIPGIAPDGSGGLNASSFLNKETGDVEVEAAFKAGISPEDLKAAVRRGRAIKRAKGIALSGNGEETAAQGTEALVKSRQEVLKTAAAASSPAITPDSGSDIVAAVNRNTEAIQSLVSVTKDQTTNDTKLTDRQLLVQEKMFSRQRSAAEEKSLEEGKDMSGFMTPTMKKIEKKLGAGPGGQGYSGQLGQGGPNVMDMLDIGSDIMDMRKGKVRRITQGRDGRTARQRLRDMKARKAGLNPSRVAGRGGGLARTGGNALTRGAGMGRGLGTAAKGLGGGGALGGLKGAAKGLGKSGPMALLTAGLEFGDRKAQGQSNLQAGVGTAGSVGGGLAGAAAGAAIGSVIPVLGTAAGALIGGMLGSMAGGGIADTVTGANNIPSGAGGMLSSGPLSGYMSMLHGTELTLSGNNKKETKNIGEALGEGMIMASLGPLNSEVIKMSAKGMRHFYENMGGKDIMKDIFKGVTDALGAVGNMLGNVANTLLGGAARAGEFTPGGGLTSVGGATGEQNLAAFLSTMEASGNQNQADAFQVMLNRAADAQAGGSMKAYGTSLGDQITAREQFSPISSAIYGVSADSAAAAKYGPISRALGSNPAERKKKLLEIASQPDGLAALQKLFGGGSAADAAKVLQDFKSGGALSQKSSSDIGSMVSFRGYRSGAGDFNRGAGGNFFFGKGSKGKVGSLAQVSPVPESADPEAVAGAGGAKVISVNHPDTGSGYSVEGLKDSQGRPAVFSRGGAAAFARMMKDSKGVVKGSDIASSKRSRQKNRAVGGVEGSNHLTGNALDIHGASQTWMRNHGAKYGWIVNDYPGSHGGHFNFKGAGAAQVAPPSPVAGAPAPAGGNTPGAQPAAAPTPVAAAPAAANTGTPMMQTSAQVATAQVASAQPIIVNNNYYSTGGGGQTQVTPNNLTPGIGMNSSGLSAFQELRLRALG